MSFHASILSILLFLSALSNLARLITQGLQNFHQAGWSKGLARSRRGFISGNGTLGIINDVFSLIGVPLFRNATGGDAAAQQRQIAIADLQVKVAEIENKRGELANQLRERVILEVLDFDQIRREFQVSQEIARRETLRLQIIEQNYRFAVGTMNTPQYLAQLSALDGQKANTFRSWARLRSQLTRIKLLVLGSE